MKDDINIPYDIARFIEKQCEAWDDWKRLSEEEQLDTIEGYKRALASSKEDRP